MGTPEIAESVLRAVLSLEETCGESCRVVGVFTQPDKPVGRKQVLTPPPVKVLAEERGIPVFQPKRIKRPVPVQQLKDLEPDLIVVAAYGQILSQEILDIPKYGCINVHTSLLPAYRGAAPIQWAIVNGESMTGVTTMLMDAGMDTGDILLQQEVPIDPSETEETLYEKLSKAGSELIIRTVEKLLKGENLERFPQEEEKATYAPIIRKEDGQINWRTSAQAVDQLVRGFHLWPGAYTSFGGKKLTVLSIRVLTEAETQALRETFGPFTLQPGELLSPAAKGKKPRLIVGCEDSLLELTRAQLQGKKPMAAADLLRGVRELPERMEESE